MTVVKLNPENCKLTLQLRESELKSWQANFDVSVALCFVFSSIALLAAIGLFWTSIIAALISAGVVIGSAQRVKGLKQEVSILQQYVGEQTPED